MVSTTTTATFPDTSTGDLVLRVRGTSRNGQTVRLRSAKCTIGSGPRCTLRLRAPGVGPLHCLILRGPGGTVVRRWSPDTRLNHQAFTDSPLVSGDQLSIGAIELEVVEAGWPAEAPCDAAVEETVEQPSELVVSVDPALVAALDARQGELDARQGELDARQGELNERQVELDARQGELDARQVELDARQTDLDAELNARRHELDEDCRQWESRRDETQRKLDEQAARFDAMRVELDGHRKSFDDERRKWEAKQSETQQQLDQKARQLESSRTDLDASRTLLDQRTAQIESMRQSLEAELEVRQSELEAREAICLAQAATEPESEYEPADVAEPVPVRPDAPVSLADVFRRVGVADVLTDDEPEEENREDTVAEPPRPERGDRYVMPSTEATSSPSETHAGGGEESIDDYMSRLLARVRGESSESAPSPRPSPAPRPRPQAAARREPEPAAPSVSPAGPSPASHESDKPAEMVRRSVDPAKHIDLSAMRELANLSAQHAITKHAQRQILLTTGTKLLIAMTGMVVGVLLLWMWGLPGTTTVTFYAALVSFLVALLWGVQYAVLTGRLILNKVGHLEWAMRDATPAVPATSEGTQSPSAEPIEPVVAATAAQDDPPA